MKKLILIIIGVGVLWAIISFVKPKELEQTTSCENTGLYESSGTPQSAMGTKASSEFNEADSDSSCEQQNDDCGFITHLDVGGKSLGWRVDDYDRAQLYFDDKMVSDAQILRLDSVSPTTCRISTIGYQADFDLKDPDVFEKMKDFFNPLDGVERFQKTYTHRLSTWKDDEGKLHQQNAYYFFTLDFPVQKLEQRESLAKWLTTLISISQDMEETASEENAFNVVSNPSKHKGELYSGNVFDVDKLGTFASNKAFKERVDDYRMDDMFDVVFVTDYRAYILNDKFATYGAFVHSHEAFGHGMYTERFYTYDLENKRMAHNSNLFKKGTLDKVKWLVFESLANNKYYQPYNGIVPTAQEVAEILDNSSGTGDGEKFDLPNGALLPEGVVFSFQPYEIDCFAAGAIHVVVPYSKIKPYMTDWAKSLINELSKK